MKKLQLALRACKGRLWNEAIRFLRQNFEFIPTQFVHVVMEKGGSFHTAQRYLYIAKQLGLVKVVRRRGRLPIYRSELYCDTSDRLNAFTAQTRRIVGVCPEHGELTREEVFEDEVRGIRLLKCIYCGSIVRRMIDI
ncbi:MAG: hypothetical protein DRJ96_10220 [Thermoprotei archaeon]|nr:MAG: hypothetical protein DRJ96_10220 [Thermoprotei archaeon]